MFSVTSSQSGGGVINYTTKEMVLNQNFVNGDTSIEFGLHGIVTNFSPTVSLPSAMTIPCGNSVQIDADINDIDGGGNEVDTVWFVDGAFAQRGSTTLSTSLSPGSHDILIRVVDGSGGYAEASTTLHVAADTTPPTVVTEPASICIWPPNHKNVVFTSDDVSVIVTDNCDPSPVVTFLDGTSSQPDNGVGDGNTSNDLVVRPDSVCVRAERQGTQSDQRTYGVRVVATDASGNASAPTEALVVDVPHDQRPGNECALVIRSTTSDEDTRCEPPAAARPAGCSATSKPGTFFVLAALMLVFGCVRRRRLRGANGGW
jgi:uncharacterized protein (TIGR03382 family)